MAPLPGRSQEQVFTEMREQLDAGGTVKIGAPSYTHGAIKDADGRYRLRALVLPRHKVDDHRARNGGRFTPGDASRLAEAAGEIVFESDTLDGLIQAMRGGAVRVL
jgi:hypothetical protein